MNRKSIEPAPSCDTPSKGSVLLAGGVIVGAAVAAYHGSFRLPFVFDDAGSIANNQTIRSLWPIWRVLQPLPGGLPVSGRPILNLSFALNYAVSGLEGWSYHVVNLAIHILAGLTLFAIVRRTIARKSENFGKSENRESGKSGKRESGKAENWLEGTGGSIASEHTLFALAVALIWTLHPLQTEAVVYVSQRAESLMGLFYLLTLYFFIRAADSEVERLAPKPLFDAVREKNSDDAPNPTAWGQAVPPRNFGGKKSGRKLWAWLSVLACLLGMATKEVMVSAPLIVLLYDRTFVAGTFGNAWRLRRKYYLGLASTWLVLIWLVLGAGGRGGTAGFGLKVTPSAYALVQFQAIVHYLRLVLWPHPLVFYYGRMAAGAAVIGVDAGMVILLVAGTVSGLFWRVAPGDGGRARNCRSHVLGFAGACFFAILAPSSSIVPVGTEMVAEHRMYLPLAAVIVVLVGGIYFLCGRFAAKQGFAACSLVFFATAAGFGFMTADRVNDYRSGLALWHDTLEKMPDNPTASNNLGIALAAAGRAPEAIAGYEEALKIDPNHPEILNNLGTALVGAGRISEAIAAYERALRLKPDYAAAHDNLGVALSGTGHWREAISHFEEAARILPHDPMIYYNMGIALAGEDRWPEAIAVCEHALQLKPAFPEAENLFGNALRDMGRVAEAGSHYAEAVRLKPDFPEARNNWGGALLETGRKPEAISQFREALRLDPGYFEAHCNLGFALASVGRLPEARIQFEEALRLRPGDAQARATLDRLNHFPQGP